MGSGLALLHLTANHSSYRRRVKRRGLRRAHYTLPPADEIEAVGTTEERRTDYTYDSRFFGKATSITEPLVFAGSSKVTTTTYVDYGNPLTETVSGFTPDGTPVTRTVTREYNGPLHQLSKVDGPRTDVADITLHEYHPDDPAEGDDRARLKRVIGPDGVLERASMKYTATGKLRAENRPNDLRIRYKYYDGSDRLSNVIEIDDLTGEERTTHFTYTATGEVQSISTGWGTPDETTLTFHYDDARYLLRVKDALDNVIRFKLDTEGNLYERRIVDPAGTLHSKLQQTFDLYNRLNASTLENESRDYDYAPDGTLNRVIDGNGTTTAYDYDALKRLLAGTRNLGGSDPATGDSVTAYDYDAGDRLTRVTDAKGNRTTYVYDDLGNPLSQSSPDTGTTTYSHDEAGNLTQMTDAKGQVFVHSYDIAGRLSGI
ncbi:MAG: hypothetical protein U9R74_18740 [Pseudomonadota bacterium]|nr:hypothetical protein [Pseudomonadota bacterium]